MITKLANLQKEETVDVDKIKKELTKMFKNKLNS